MVALSSSSSSASSEPDALPTLEEILADPQRHFPRLLFDADPLAVLELLNSLLLRFPERGGHSTAIECLWCWQDLTESAFSLSALLDELRTVQDVQVVVAGLRLLARLLQFAPDRVSRARLRNEMDELQLDELVIRLREQFRGHPELDEPIAEWRRAKAEEMMEMDAARVSGRADADSGTFSGDEAEEAAGKRGQMKDGQIWADQLAAILGNLAKRERDELLQLVRQLAQLHVERLGQTLEGIQAMLSAGCSAPVASVPAPPPLPPCQAPQKPPMPPPPPPILKPQPMAISSSQLANEMPPPMARTQPTASADIPRSLRPKALPDEGRRLRHLQWAKVPANVIVAGVGWPQGSANIWQAMDSVDRELRDQLDFTALDALFGCPSAPSAGPEVGNVHRRRASMMPPNQQCQQDCFSLLAPRRSLSVSVFLKMCRDTEQLLRDLCEGKAESIGADRLRTLAQLLPSKEEQKSLLEFAGNPASLGQAEQFLLALITRIPEHRLRLEAMLFQLDLETMKASGTGLEPWLKGAHELLNSSALRKLLYILLHSGNYLNHGAGAGNAVGFRLSSLWKVEDVKAIGGKGRRTLLHFVAHQAGNSCAEELAKQLGSVREATKTSLEAIRDDLKGLIERQQQLEALLGPKKAESDSFFVEFCHFLENSRPFTEMANGQLAKLATLRQQLATFFCEPERTFSLEDCFKVVGSFVVRLEKAAEENRKNESRKGADDERNDATNNAGTNSARSKHYIEPKLVATNGKKAAEKKEPTTWSSPAFLNRERPKQQENGGTIGPPAITSNAGRRRATLAAVPSVPENGQVAESAKKEKSGAGHSRRSVVPGSEASDSLEAIINSALGQQQENGQKPAGNGPKMPSIPVSTAFSRIRAAPASALISISDGAKDRLSNGNAKKDPTGVVAKKIGQYEDKTDAANAAGAVQGQQLARGARRLAAIGRVRSTQISAIVQLGPTARPSPLRRQHTVGGYCATPTRALAIKGEAASKLTKSNVPSPQALTKVPPTPLAQKSPPSSQIGQAKSPAASVATPKGPRTKPVLTRQVSTASRPALVSSGSSEKKPKWV